VDEILNYRLNLLFSKKKLGTRLGTGLPQMWHRAATSIDLILLPYVIWRLDWRKFLTPHTSITNTWGNVGTNIASTGASGIKANSGRFSFCSLWYKYVMDWRVVGIQSEMCAREIESQKRCVIVSTVLSLWWQGAFILVLDVLQLILSTPTVRLGYAGQGTGKGAAWMLY
jgi:hypothetical protein